jgi:hypothetical protein
VDAAPDRDMVNGEAPLGHHLLQVAIGERVSQVPPDAQEDDHVFEMPSAEQRWLFSGHDLPYQHGTLLLQQNLWFYHSSLRSHLSRSAMGD